MNRLAIVWRALACIALIHALTGCAGWAAYRQAHRMLAEGNLRGGVEKLGEASRQDPANTQFRREYHTLKERAAHELLTKVQAALGADDLARAKSALHELQGVDPANVQAQSYIERIAMLERHAALVKAAQAHHSAKNFSRAQDLLSAVLRENPSDRRTAALARQMAAAAREASDRADSVQPRLGEAYRKPVSLVFADATLLQAFESLRLASGINFVFDQEVRTDSKLTISVKDKPLEEVLRAVLSAQRLTSRVLDGNTVMIYPNTPDKARDHQELLVRTFYLATAEAAKVQNLLKSVLRMQHLHVDEKTNTLVVRDTPDTIRLAERLIANLDVAEPEVMLELEVLEVSANRLVELGIQYPSFVAASVSGVGGLGAVSLADVRRSSSDLVSLQLSNPVLGATLRESTGAGNLLANPRIRIRNRQAAKVLIGERVPVITTVSTANVGTAESVSYLDVGLKLELEPTVSLDDEVSMRVALEVSSIIGTVSRASGLQAYRLGTRNATTKLRVRDNETQVLAGLIQREERTAAAGLPGLMDIPLAGRLFSATSDSANKTEIVLLITPRVVRNVNVPGIEQLELPAGTESNYMAGSGAVGLRAGPGGVATPAPPGMLPGAPPLHLLAPTVTVLPPQQPETVFPPPVIPAPLGAGAAPVFPPQPPVYPPPFVAPPLQPQPPAGSSR